MSKQKTDEVTGVETTGHSWDGIEELNNPLPRWWLWTLYLCIIWAIGYTIAYPAWPMISGATQGVMGWSTRANVAAEITAHEAANAELVTQLVAADMPTLPQDADLNRYAIARGGAVFRANCSQCHGSGAAGAKGYPNLLDDDWLWGGDIDAIMTTVRHGIRNTLDDDARYSAMPAFGDMLEPAEIDAVVEHVVSLSSSDFDAALAAQGVTVFADNCASCHGDEGLGNREMGAPNLADAIWLYGGDRATLHTTVEQARFGVMPPWGPRLKEADIRAVSAYVHSLGGGE
ncbi:cytochrome-c oxidase, cbb3-type subunit III [Sulfitobacter pseudonitzschiae]|uniref:Cbb3-type cytochrome c oxidase subunit n=1 Tax=Pseudosulfitobacter pseudonitzschiae TaxID=1402135 RepID=A0A9Q2NHT3_9RHOB|nr:cytochrome-c oxidase, cbb3-type subunit III [Pseudosulfitobacter pseudonitzschiae]MBM2290972.1 cytochrome-c oxidase, cbb3-type subunit III [Pseudosulfitobacter pseudonitzschiae]MBM2295890.1 cytochrome-c oxidase, cbb3-type subunit III [Pseudosulfitobacter pseudonitzschiae]MBM2300803.1 cytochrome-c oxidase, cbb3-type subunit III [Pseudosulfitobacter pseudonitzschiae]MBM2310587.1 cytochrome-c oxidase, cbb3-type subunit III [Pseudosulfitobacter pseudonitzschiae]MBM2315500.1 cytochrome-c oxidase